MSLREKELRGIGFLLSHRNSDNGIPAVNLQDISGCWTTASTVETLLLGRYLPKKELVHVRSMVEFLLNRQNTGEGWPISVGTQQTSTMATGHTIAALSLATGVFHADNALVNRIEKAREIALDWLHRTQNDEGDWGVEPATEVGKKSSTMATCYAIRGFLSTGQNYESSRDIQEGINYLISKVGFDGGWGQREGISSDPANTARVVCTILQSGKYDVNHPVIKRALAFILSTKKEWKIKVESYVVAGAPGQVYFHANTPADVLEALVRCKYFGKEVEELIRFFMDSQDDMNGFWQFQDFEEVDDSICTWTTAEALAVLDLAHEAYANHLFRWLGWKHTKYWQVAFIVAATLCALEFLYIVDANTGVVSWWKNLSESWRQVIVGSVVIGLIVGIIANLMSQKIRALFMRIGSCFLNRKK